MKPETLVMQFYKRKKQSQPQYSMRALARDLNVSASFFNEVIKGKKKMPPAWIIPLARILSLDDIAVADLKNSVLISHIRGSELEALFNQNEFPGVSKTSVSRLLDRHKFSILSKWYYIAVLDYLTLEKITDLEGDIARRLNLSVAAVREAIDMLKKLGLIKIDKNQRLQKTDRHIRVPTSKSDPLVRNFHMQMIDKAKFELLRNTSDSDFQKRLITGSTIAADPRHIQKIKQRLQSFLAEIAQEFSSGTVEELYQFNMQLFPLTKSKP